MERNRIMDKEIMEGTTEHTTERREYVKPAIEVIEMDHEEGICALYRASNIGNGGGYQ
jgi:hypothetical protein